MKTLRAHDYPAAIAPPVPNLKAFRRIIAGFVVASLFCLAMTLLLAFRMSKTPKSITVTRHCACDRCLR